ncbi:hypothetical protein [Qipengyuania sp. MTN3-11]|uniref:hypothetical protein n=1 Tax=Qipengyuania sp. MTN3-11 TaxID=3056557 RepID=UPI0036F31310
MTMLQKSVLWAAAMILAAILGRVGGLSDGAMFGIVAGLSGAAVGSIRSRKSACGSCA